MADEGREGQGGPTEAVPLPEGAHVDGEAPAGPAQSERLQTLRAERVSPIGLDILVEADEPEEVMIRLSKLAQKRHDQPRWDIIWKHASACIHELEAFNLPSSRR